MPRTPTADINVTPLIDVLLVLLIILWRRCRSRRRGSTLIYRPMPAGLWTV